MDSEITVGTVLRAWMPLFVVLEGLGLLAAFAWIINLWVVAAMAFSSSH